VNWQKNTEGDLDFKVVGIFDSSYPQEKQLSFQSNQIVWNDGTRKASLNFPIFMEHRVSSFKAITSL